MANDIKFAEALVNLDHEVLGFKLAPFSIWHKFLLGFYESPIMDPGKELKPDDILKAIQVCRCRFPDIPKPLSIWSKLRILSRTRDPEVEARKFSDYIEDFLSFPEFWNKDGEDAPKSTGAPDTLTMAMAMMRIGFDETASWDMPLGKAHWYSAVYAMQKGADISFLTDEERHMQENMDDIMEDMEAARQRFMEEQKSGG